MKGDEQDEIGDVPELVQRPNSLSLLITLHPYASRARRLVYTGASRSLNLDWRLLLRHHDFKVAVIELVFVFFGNVFKRALETTNRIVGAFWMWIVA